MKGHHSTTAGGAAVSLGECPLVTIGLDVSLGPKFTSASAATEAGSRIQEEGAENRIYLFFSQLDSLFLPRKKPVTVF